ncbi:acyltransferase family protein [Leucobacter sp. NPDC077196]|uniref:acyltransferase family protein n=1 Tax=Leucobacter sp. NPDC077196 TaxID=3154959 RepID=UPI0034160B28
MSTPTTVSAPGKAGAPRVAFWDNARFALIALVVIGHAISTVRHDSALAYGIYTYIFLFHMPALILLSGYFSRANASSKTIRATVQLIVLWVLWEGIWAVIGFAAIDETPADTFLVSPSWTLWYLVTIVTMRIMLPYMAQLRHPLLVSIVIALLGGVIPVIGTEFSAARTLTFLPFFIAGWLARDRGWLSGQWFALPRRWVRVASWGILAFIAAVFLVLPGLRSWWRLDSWLTWRDGYDGRFADAPIGDWSPHHWLETTLGGLAVTAVLLALAAAMTFAVLGVTPRRRLVITDWGARTLSVYLLHGPIIWVLRHTGVIDAVGGFGELGVAILIVGAVALAALLALAPVERAFRWVLVPNLDWLFGSARQEADRGAR